MYLVNKYTRWYYSLINAANERTVSNDEYVEKHHIIPKSLGGSNQKDNIVLLTAREHFVCHLLLIRMTLGKNKAKMVNAALRLATDRKERKVNARLYEHIKKERQLYLSITMVGEGNHFYGRKHSDETRRKMSDSRRKWYYTEDHLAKFRGREGPMKGKTHSEGTRQKLSMAAKGRIHTVESRNKTSKSLLEKNLIRSDETKEKMRQAKVGIKHPIKQCIHCSKFVTAGMYARWHGDNCKIKDIPVCHDLERQQ
jgi:hypothetical protein